MTTAAATGYADVAGARLYYEVAGEGESVVFVHGLSLDTRMWDEQWEAFTGAYRCVRVDVRGHGRSSPPDGPYRRADDIAAVLDHLGIEHAHMIGLSMGGAAVVNFALLYPERVRSITAIDSILHGRPWSPEFLQVIGAVFGLGRAGDVDGARAAWLASPLFAPALRDERVAPRLREIIGAYSCLMFTHDDPDLPLVPEAVHRLSEISAPLLAIVGELDGADFHDIASLLATRTQRGRLLVIEGAGHMANMERPAEVNAAIGDFLASVR